MRTTSRWPQRIACTSCVRSPSRAASTVVPAIRTSVTTFFASTTVASESAAHPPQARTLRPAGKAGGADGGGAARRVHMKYMSVTLVSVASSSSGVLPAAATLAR